MKRLQIVAALILAGLSGKAQFAPQAGVSGTDAIHKGSALIKAWANTCTVTRGRMDIADLSSGWVSVGSDADACGAADGMVVSLGDSGVATLSFNTRIFDGPGPDFAIFENGFANPTNPEESFMELGFVEVSSDGEHFFRFPSVSNSGTATQVPGAGVYMNARLVHNLAGKYIAQYGTPFDLADLKGVSGLDPDRISHIRVVDVVGSIGAHASRDSKGQLINDPYPTKFASGGFDLDAVAAINLVPSGIRDFSEAGLKIFPIPASDELSVAGKESIAGTLYVSDLQGRLLLQQTVAGAVGKINIGHLPAGTYFLSLDINDGSRCSGTFTKF